jgi:hypothetical protein
MKKKQSVTNKLKKKPIKYLGQVDSRYVIFLHNTDERFVQQAAETLLTQIQAEIQLELLRRSPYGDE